jgi:hypothetical protein
VENLTERRFLAFAGNSLVIVSSCGEVRVSVATAAELMRELLNVEILIAAHP